MDVDEQIKALAKAYKHKGKDLDLVIMQRICPGVPVYAAVNFLKSHPKYAPANMNGYDWKIRKLAEIYFTLA